MLPTAHDVRVALARFADAVVTDERCPTTESARARENAAYTLCVMTGTTEATQAVAAADEILRLRAQNAPEPVRDRSRVAAMPTPAEVPLATAPAAAPSAEGITEAA
nr:DUF5133 domain-containing protein [Streptomyces sp. SID14478]